MRLPLAARSPLAAPVLLLLACSEAALDPDSGPVSADATAPRDAGSADAGIRDAAMPECGPFENWSGPATPARSKILL